MAVEALRSAFESGSHARRSLTRRCANSACGDKQFLRALRENFVSSVFEKGFNTMDTK